VILIILVLVDAVYLFSVLRANEQPGLQDR
jgi:hypothetical protein